MLPKENIKEFLKRTNDKKCGFVPFKTDMRAYIKKEKESALQTNILQKISSNGCFFFLFLRDEINC